MNERELFAATLDAAIAEAKTETGTPAAEVFDRLQRQQRNLVSANKLWRLQSPKRLKITSLAIVTAKVAQKGSCGDCNRQEEGIEHSADFVVVESRDNTISDPVFGLLTGIISTFGGF